jgi:hypothetical protein
MAPLVGARPLRPAATLQRSTEPAPGDLHAPISRGFDADLAGVRFDRTREGAGTADRMAARAFTQGDEIVLPSHSPLDSGPARSLVAHELTHVAQQRRYGEALPDEGSPDGQRLELQAQSGEGSVSRGAELPLAPVQRASVETLLDRSAPSSDSAPQVVQRGWLDSASSEFSGLSSRGPSLAEAGSAVSTVGSAIGSMFSGHKAAETDIDELAGKLYDRIRTRLKSELLVDRERAGFLTDLR